jgi:hypothetical protein
MFWASMWKTKRFDSSKTRLPTKDDSVPSPLTPAPSA